MDGATAFVDDVTLINTDVKGSRVVVKGRPGPNKKVDAETLTGMIDDGTTENVVDINGVRAVANDVTLMDVETEGF